MLMRFDESNLMNLQMSLFPDWLGYLGLEYFDVIVGFGNYFGTALR